MAGLSPQSSILTHVFALSLSAYPQAHLRRFEEDGVHGHLGLARERLFRALMLAENSVNLPHFPVFH